MQIPGEHLLQGTIQAGGTITASLITQVGRVNFVSADVKETLEARRKELEAAEQRFRISQSEQRELQKQEFTNRQAEIDYKNMQEHWPLSIPALPIRQERKDGILDVILYLNKQQILDSLMPHGKDYATGVSSVIKNSRDNVQGRVRTYLNGRVNLRRSDPKPGHALSGDDLRDMLKAMLGHQATLLLEVTVEQGGSEIGIMVSQWGLPGRDDLLASTATKIPLPKKAILANKSTSEVEEIFQKITEDLSWGLTSVLVACSDAFQAMTYPSQPHVPVLIEFLTQEALRSGVSEAQCKALTDSHLKIYDTVALHSPVIAAEMAAKAALLAKHQQPDGLSPRLIDDLLAKAIELHPNLQGFDDPALPKVMIRQRSGKTPSDLEQALIELRSWSPPPEDPVEVLSEESAEPVATATGIEMKRGSLIHHLAEMLN